MDFGECQVWRKAGGGPPASQVPTECPLASPFPVYKARLETVEASASNPYVYYHMQLQAVIKSGTSQVAEETLGVPVPEGLTWEKMRPLYAHTLGLLSSRHRLCHAAHHEEIHLSRHLP